MGVAHFLTRLATSAPHVLVVEVGGDWLTRVTVEQAITRRGWPSVHSPADADVLAVCGPSGLSTTVDATRMKEMHSSQPTRAMVTPKRP